MTFTLESITAPKPKRGKAKAPQITPGMRAAIYLRVSTDAQAKDDAYGLAAQWSAVSEFAHQHKLVVDDAHEYVDEGISGSEMARPRLSDMLSDAREGKFDVVLTPKLDRIARDLMFQMIVEHWLTDAGVALISVSEPFGSSDPQSVLMRQILGAFAEFERSVITTRLLGGKRAKARAGGWAGGPVPYGYEAVGRKLVVFEPEAAVVRKIFRMVLMPEDGKRPSLGEIASALDRAGHRTRQGKRWSRMAIKRILDRQSLYEGTMQWDGIEADNPDARVINGTRAADIAIEIAVRKTKEEIEAERIEEEREMQARLARRFARSSRRRKP